MLHCCDQISLWGQLARFPPQHYGVQSRRVPRRLRGCFGHSSGCCWPRRPGAMGKRKANKISVPDPPLLPRPPPAPPPSGDAEHAPSSSSGAPLWNPEAVADDPKSKRWWAKGPSGRKKKIRAMAHWLKLNQQHFCNMANNDFQTPGLAEAWSPSHEFRRSAAKYQVIRYFIFLLQMVLTLVRVWKPSRKQVKHYGLGVHTPQRRALLMMHSGTLPPESRTQLRSLQRHLWGRVAEEAKNLSTIESMSRDECDRDHVFSAMFRLKDHIAEQMLPGIESGKYPKVRIDENPQDQYAECWKDRASVLGHLKPLYPQPWSHCVPSSR